MKKINLPGFYNAGWDGKTMVKIDQKDKMYTPFSVRNGKRYKGKTVHNLKIMLGIV